MFAGQEKKRVLIKKGRGQEKVVVGSVWVQPGNAENGEPEVGVKRLKTGSSLRIVATKKERVDTQIRSVKTGRSCPEKHSPDANSREGGDLARC